MSGRVEWVLEFLAEMAAGYGSGRCAVLPEYALVEGGPSCVGVSRWWRVSVCVQ